MNTKSSKQTSFIILQPNISGNEGHFQAIMLSNVAFRKGKRAFFYKMLFVSSVVGQSLFCLLSSCESLTASDRYFAFKAARTALDWQLLLVVMQVGS